MNIKRLAGLLSDEFNLPREECVEIINFMLEEIASDIAVGERVYFRGFGAFHCTLRPPKKYRNMKTNKIETRPAFLDVEFRPAPQFREKIKQCHHLIY